MESNSSNHNGKKLIEGKKDPFTQYRTRWLNSADKKVSGSRRTRVAQRQTMFSSRTVEVQRKRHMLLGLSFALIAVIVFSYTHLAAPRILVDTGNIEGNVIIDGEMAGHQNQIIKSTVGLHRVTFIPDDTTLVTMPALHSIRTAFNVQPHYVHFTVITRSTENHLPSDPCNSSSVD